MVRDAQRPVEDCRGMFKKLARSSSALCICGSELLCIKATVHGAVPSVKNMPRLFKKKRKRDGPENTRKLKQFPPRDKTLNVSQRRLKGQAFRQRTRGTRIEEYRAVGVQKDGVESKSTDQYK